MSNIHFPTHLKEAENQIKEMPNFSLIRLTKMTLFIKHDVGKHFPFGGNKSRCHLLGEQFVNINQFAYHL